MPGLFDGTPLERPVTCPDCAQQTCACPKDAAGDPCPPNAQSPRVRREKRRGSWNTIVAGVRAAPEPGPQAKPGAQAKPGDLKPLLKDLRTRLGTGGGLSDSPSGPEIVLQGDHREAVVNHLTQLGYKAKASGG